MDGPVGIAHAPQAAWTLDAAYAYATANAVPPADCDGEPLYNCPFQPCAKQFSKRFNLKAHLRVHTGDKPFACSFAGCTRRFMWKSSLTSHQMGHSRRKAEMQKRNAVMAGKALAAEGVQIALRPPQVQPQHSNQLGQRTGLSLPVTRPGEQLSHRQQQHQQQQHQQQRQQHKKQHQHEQQCAQQQDHQERQQQQQHTRQQQQQREVYQRQVLRQHHHQQQAYHHQQHQQHQQQQQLLQQHRIYHQQHQPQHSQHPQQPTHLAHQSPAQLVQEHLQQQSHPTAGQTIVGSQPQPSQELSRQSPPVRPPPRGPPQSQQQLHTQQHPAHLSLQTQTLQHPEAPFHSQPHSVLHTPPLLPSHSTAPTSHIQHPGQQQTRPEPHRVLQPPQPSQSASMSAHPSVLYGRIGRPTHSASRQQDSHLSNAVVPHVTQGITASALPQRSSPDPTAALSYITAEEAPNSSPPSSLPMGPSQLHMKQPPHPNAVAGQQQGQAMHAPQSAGQQRPPDRVVPPHHAHAPQQPVRSSHSLPQEKASPPTNDMSGSRVEGVANPRGGYTGERALKSEASSHSLYADQQLQAQHARQEDKPSVGQSADQQHELLQQQRRAWERQDQQIKEQQRIIHQQRQAHERRFMELKEREERHRREYGVQQPHTTSPTDQQQGLVSSLDQGRNGDNHMSFQRLEDPSHRFGPHRTTPTLPPSGQGAHSSLGSAGLGPGLIKREGLPMMAKSSSANSAPSAPTALPANSVLPSPSAPMGLTRSPNSFSQRFLFPSHATSPPAWASTPTVPPVQSGVSLTAASPKLPPGTGGQMHDVHMPPLNAELRSGDISPVPSDVAISPGIVTSPVPPPILPQVSANNRHRRGVSGSLGGLSRSKPPLAGPSLTAGASALLAPLNVTPAAPPTHIDLGGLMGDEEPNSSLPALGSPHTDSSPLPVASPIFANGQTPTSPMQPFSPFSGMYGASTRGKQTPTW